MKETILEIVDLIEDNEFPAKRSISDYIIILLHKLKIEEKTIEEVEKIFEREYEKRTDKQCFSQSEWKRKLENIESKI